MLRGESIRACSNDCFTSNLTPKWTCDVSLRPRPDKKHKLFARFLTLVLQRRYIFFDFGTVRLFGVTEASASSAFTFDRRTDTHMAIATPAPRVLADYAARTALAQIVLVFSAPYLWESQPRLPSPCLLPLFLSPFRHSLFFWLEQPLDPVVVFSRWGSTR